MALEGYCVLTPVYPVSENMERTKEQLINLKEAHFKRIELSDTILVVNINNYIGDSTRAEIDYAKKLGKEIIYYTNLINFLQIIKHKLLKFFLLLFLLLLTLINHHNHQKLLSRIYHHKIGYFPLGPVH